MDFRGILLGAALACCGCTCRRHVDPVSRDDDARAIEDARHVAEPDRERFTVIGTDVIDLAAKRVVHSFPLRPDRFVVDAGAVYAWSEHRLSVVELPSGKSRWSYEDRSPQPVVGMLVDDRRLFMAWRDVVYAFDRATGERSTWMTPPKDVRQIARLGRSLIVISDVASVSFVDIDDRSARVVPPINSATGSIDYVGEDHIGCLVEMFMIYTGIFGVPAWSVVGVDDRGGATWAPVTITKPIAATLPGIVQSTETHLLFSAERSGHTLVLRRATGALDLDRSGLEAEAMIEDASGNLDLLLARSSTNTYDVIDVKGGMPYRVVLPCATDTIRTVSTPNDIFVAGFDPGDGGGCVIAIDRKDGRVGWHAELTNPRIAHSEYMNDVTLQLRGDELVVIGREAGAEHVDVFALANGDRRFAHVVPF